MGIFDNLFGTFTGEAGIQASHDIRTFLQTLMNDTTDRLNTGENQSFAYLQSGMSNARDALSDSLGPATRFPREYGVAGINAVNEGLEGAREAFNPLEDIGEEYGARSREASDMSADALGLRGSGGVDRATAAFRTGPGYDFMREEGLEGIARNQNRAGMLASGNQMRESQRYASGLADQEFDDWLTRLSGREQLYSPLGMQATGAVGAGRAGAENIAAGRVADINTGVGRQLSDLYSNYGRNLASLETAGGGALATNRRAYDQLQAEIVRALGPAAAVTFMAQANAQNTAGSNTSNLIGDVFSGLGDFFDIF